MAAATNAFSPPGYVSGHPEQLQADSTGDRLVTFVYSAGTLTETVTFTTRAVAVNGGTTGSLVYVNGKLKTRTDQT